MKISNKDLKRRIIEISYKYRLSHLGSCLTAVDIIEKIYAIKKPSEKFVLSSGHAGLALYVVLEKHTGKSAEDIFNHHGVHPDRCSSCGLDCSNGSLGCGLPIALGMALADRKKNVYCLISDGECSEGSIWETLRIRSEYNIENLNIYVNINGYGAYKEIDGNKLHERMGTFSLLSTDGWRVSSNHIRYTDAYYLPFLKGLDAHYYTMTEKDYKQAMEILK